MLKETCDKKANTNGIGLGLVIADKIVGQFDGKITVQSVYGIGSNFTFTMKLFTEEEYQDMNT